MSGLRGLNVNGLGERFWDRKTRELQPNLRRLTRESVASRAQAGVDNFEAGLTDDEKTSFSGMSSDAASRHHLEVLLENLGSESMAAITAPDRPEVVPDLAIRNVGLAPDLRANMVTYQQSAASIPIFGAQVVVDVDRSEKTMVAVNGQLAPPPLESPLAQLSPIDAWHKLVAWCHPASAPDHPSEPPTLTWYVDRDEKSHLTYHFKRAELEPPRPDGDAAESIPCIGHGGTPSSIAYDYLVDAGSGEVRFYFASAPQFIPAPMRGMDSFNQNRRFYGLNNGAGAKPYVLRDPLRNIETYDYAFGDIDAGTPLPASPVSFAQADVGTSSPAAVSAHWHAQIVFDFFNDVLKRKSVDDKGMKLVSVVNVYSSRSGAPHPEWGNAAWWRNTMWYGQEPDGAGAMKSFARFLDVIAHELTHGVTSSSSNLIYRDLPGALNESFSDIFGVMVANWYPQAPNPVSGWNWRIGEGIGAGGAPLRDFSNPAAAGQPDHMDQYQPLPEHRDHGGVHIYSGIHNKAVHKLLTAVGAGGNPAIPTAELALLLYLTLIRLTPTSDFTAARRTLLTVAGVFYADHPELDQRIELIEASYDSVGIH